MTGLERVPTLSDLGEAYLVLQNPQALIDVSQWSLWSQWSRFDPRLAEQWVAHCARSWRSIPSGELNLKLSQLPWPHAGALLLAHVELFHLASKAEKKSFSLWSHSVTAGIEPSQAAELFFIGTRAFAGKQAWLDASRSLSIYKKWGYLGREILRNKAASQLGEKLTLVSAHVRRSVLNDLIQRQTRIRVSEYRAALDGQVSLRQAERDLRGSAALRAVGETKGRFYVVRTRKSRTRS